MSPWARIYAGKVRHKRLRPEPHALTYCVFSLLVDVDHLPELAASSRFFGYNRWSLFSLFDRDFGKRDGTSIASQARALLEPLGLDTQKVSIWLLAYPRVLGYAFNPLSVFYVFDAEQRLVAMIYEVTNTFAERRCYVVTADAPQAGTYAHACAKDMYVSPFAPATGTYSFRITNPADDLLVGVMFRDHSGPLIKTHFRADAQPFTNLNLLKCAVFYPLMTLKVIAGIHFEALRLWLKRIPLHRRPKGPKYATTLTKTPN